MTDEQFDDWFRRVNLRFPSITAFFAKKTPDDAAEQCAFWKQQTRRMTLDQCDAALEAMFTAETDPHAGKWFKVFCAVAKRFASKSTVVEYRDGERLSECPNNCSLDGFVYIRGASAQLYKQWCDAIKARIAAGEVDFGYKNFPQGRTLTLNMLRSWTVDEVQQFWSRRHPHTILCNCDKGFRGESKIKQLPIFDPSRFTLAENEDRNYFPGMESTCGLVELPWPPNVSERK